MSQIIAGLYEIEKEIGAGGGGIVYLGHHIRLQKKVVLKADKRSLSTDEASLRREVDFLKGLSNTYIPQVYDYVQENGIVYTVMDYIDGESLDKLLKRKQYLAQPEIIKWSCQLLEALSYLHKQEPHGILHGDIKPANIMLRKNGDICLIDFNIALALGEDGAVKVGYSRGYASPEHYGSSYISENRPAAIHRFNTIKQVQLSEEKKAGDVVSSEAKSYNDDKTECLCEENEYKTEFLYGEDEHKTELLWEEEGEKTELLKGEEFQTELMSIQKVNVDRGVRKTEGEKSKQQSLITGSNTGSGGGIMLDVRSDIYSLGATLYHLISGKRPSQNAEEVEPLGEEVCSPAVASIIAKAMAPDPVMRYQTAEEMRNAFFDLYKNDIRVCALKSQSIITALILMILFFIGGGCTFVGLSQLEKLQKALVLAEYSTNALEEGNVSKAVKYAMDGVREEIPILKNMSSKTQSALTEALGVYDLKDGFKALDTVEIPAVPFHIVFSPEGTYFAVTYAYEAAVYETSSLKEIIRLPMQESALADVNFIKEAQIVYAGIDGITAYDLLTSKVLWQGENAIKLSLSEDKTKLAAVNADKGGIKIYEVSTGEVLKECSFGGRRISAAYNEIFADPETDIFTLNQDGNLLALSFSDGSLTIFDLEKQENNIQVLEASEASKFTGGFYKDYFAFTMQGSGNSTFRLIDIKNSTCVAGYDSVNKLLLQTNEQGIYLADGNLLVSIDPEKMEEKEVAYTEGTMIMDFSIREEDVLIATNDNGFSFYRNGQRLSKEVCEENCDFIQISKNYAIVANRNQNVLRVLENYQYEETKLLSYDLDFVHDEARISHDKENVMFFNYEEFAVCDKYGEVICQMNLPDAETIYDQQFIREDNISYLEVIWYDGRVRHYSAKDGSLLYEIQDEVPAKNLYEEFLTDSYRVVSNLHSAPEVYERETGELVAILEEDAYLTYVSQVGVNILTEYISTSGERFGVLLNHDLEKTAVLPGLCDFWEDMLIFEDKTGILRHSRLYSPQELMTLGETYIEHAKEEN